MQKKVKYFIFDLDGTLYKFDKELSPSFKESQFRKDLKNRVLSFISNTTGFDEKKSLIEYENLKLDFNGDFSLALNSKYGVPKEEYTSVVWKMDPQNYIKKNTNLRNELQKLKGRIALVTGSPKIWAIPTLKYLNLLDLFEPSIFTYDFSIKKPDPNIFLHVTKHLNAKIEDTIAIGDNLNTDILPAKKVGLKTLFIGEDRMAVADFQAKDINQALKKLVSL